MAHEINSNNEIAVYDFIVTRSLADGTDPVATTKRFFDYAAGWDWARSIKREIEANDPDFGTDDAYFVAIDFEMMWSDEIDNE